MTMLTPTRRRIIPLFLVGTLALAACGGSDDAGDGADLSGADLSGADAEFAAALAETWASEGELPPELDSSCLATGFTRAIGGVEGAEAYGVTAENVADTDFDDTPLEQDDALAAAEEWYGCENFKAAFVTGFAPDANDEQVSCLAEAIRDEPLTALVASTFMGDNARELEERYENDFESDMLAGLESCGING